MDIITSLDLIRWLQDNSLREAECDDGKLLEMDELNQAILNGGVIIKKVVKSYGSVKLGYFLLRKSSSFTFDDRSYDFKY